MASVTLMMVTSALLAAPASATAVSAAAAGLAVQDTAQASTEASAGVDELIYRRETFVYPGDNRRNPFVSLLTLSDAGPQFDDLDLVGIIFGGSMGSVATLVDRATDKRYRVRRGDSVGNARVVEIRPDEVVFRVTSFGVTRSETLRVRKEEEEEQG